MLREVRSAAWGFGSVLVVALSGVGCGDAQATDQSEHLAGAALDAGIDALDVDAPPRRGTLSTEGDTFIAGAAFPVAGTGWTPGADVRVAFCAPLAPELPDPFAPRCRPEVSVQAGPDGAFAASATAWTVLRTGDQVGLHADCTALEKFCGVEAYDARDPSGTRVVLPLNVVPRPGLTARFDLDSPLLPAMAVRVVGSGFTADGWVDFWQCNNGGPKPLCVAIGGAPSDSAGTVRGFTHLLASWRIFILDFATVPCAAPTSTCVLKLTERGGATVTLPLPFAVADQFDVVSHYEEQWQPLLQQGLDIGGVPAAELQRQGAAGFLYVLIASGASTSTQLPAGGSLSYTTTYSRPMYLLMTNLAAGRGYTLQELQKTGTLFWSWLLAGQPPLPALQ